MRWHGDLRRFAPWQYEPHEMMSATKQHCVNMPATVKEVLMGSQPRFTCTGKGEDMQEVTLPPTSRHRMLANTWHVGVAQAVLYVFLVLALVPSARAATPIPPPASATAHVHAPHHCVERCHAGPLAVEHSRPPHGPPPHSDRGRLRPRAHGPGPRRESPGLG